MADLVIGDLALRTSVPVGAVEVESPRLDLSVAPGVAPLAGRSWVREVSGSAERVDVVCAGGNGWFWVAGFERPLLDAASGMVRRVTASPSLAVGGIEGGPPFEQNYRGDGITGRHWLGFQHGSFVVCSLVCRGGSAGCARWLEDAALIGSDVRAPAPGVIVRLATAAAARPMASAMGALALAVAAAGLILWRRPRPLR